MQKNKYTFLVVDDEVGILEVVSGMLEDLGVDSMTAKDGQEALEIIQGNKGKIDCIISDLSMPNLNGLGLIKEIRKDNLHIPFIFFSAFGNRETLSEIVKYGAFDFIDKPCLTNLDEIIHRVIDFLDKGSIKEDENQILSEYKQLLKKTAL